MTWQTTTVRYVSIGEKSARFRDLTLPFTHDGEPVETVIWLPNGGGKSSLMSLKSAVVLPAARDFTGHGREDGEKRPRRLEDYVATGDTSHTVIEWSRDDTTILLGERHRLLTGAVYEWPGRQRSTLDQNSTLNKLWWSAVPADGMLNLERLPVRDGRLLTLSQFHDELRKLNSLRPELQIQVARTQNQWEEQLGSLGIDTALYRYQARMNTSEGGIAKVFNFDSVRDFINLVVDVIATPQQASDCGKVVTQHAKNLFRRPELQTEREFLIDAGQLLGELDAAHQLVVAATQDRDKARVAALRLWSALTQAAGLQDTASNVSEMRADNLNKRASEARRERGRLEGVHAELLFLAATERHAEAGGALKSTQETEKRTRSDQAAWAAAGPLAEAAGHDAAAVELRRQLEPEREARESLRQRVDAHAVAAQALLEEQAAALREQAKAAGLQANAERRRGGDIKRTLKNTREEISDLTKAEATADALVRAQERALASARRDGLLEAAETPRQAVRRLRDVAAEAEKEAAVHAEREQGHRDAAKQAAKEMSAAGAEHVRLAGEAQSAADEEQNLRAAHDELASHDRLVALAEADATIDVWGDAPQLRRALADAAREAEAEALREAVASAEDDRLLSAADTTGLLPAPVATAAVIDRLTVAGVTAEIAWAVLARDYADADRLRAATTRPDVVSGVVVQDDATRERARTLLVSDPTLAHIPLVTAPDLAAAARGEGAPPLPAVPLHEGLHIPDAAAAAADGLRNLGESRRERQTALRERASADRGLLDALSAFLAAHPDSDVLARAAHRTTAAANAAQEMLREQGELRDANGEHDRLAGEQRRRAETLTKQAGNHRAAIARLSPLDEVEGQLEKYRETLRTAAAEIQKLKDCVEALEAEKAQADGEAERLGLEKQGREIDARNAVGRAQDIRVLEPDTPMPADQVDAARARGLTECLAMYKTLSSQWQSEVVGSVLEAKLKSAEEQASAARQRAHRALATFDGDRDAATTLARERAAAHSSEVCDAEAARATSAVESAITATANATTALASAKASLADAAAARDRVQRVTEPVEFTTVSEAEARAAELAQNIADLSSAETKLIAERELVRARSEAEAALAENLRDQAERLPNDGVAELTDVDPFPGDLNAARAAVRHAVERLDMTTEELRTAESQRADYTSKALKLASTPKYQTLALTLRERLTDSDPIRLGAKAAEYAEQTQVRLATVDDLMKQIGEDEDRVSQLVSTHVRQLLSSLVSAARASKLPTGLADLSGRQFINLRFNNPTDEELGSRVSQEVLALLDQAGGETKSLPSGDKILRQCVHAAVGVKGFKVDVLKPNEHMLEQRVPVTDVARFSDGEKLTTCVLLFCAFARMRQKGRSGGATGTLMLDNPFGRASNAQLVALQLAVAKAQRVHLVYATGIEDMGALLQFRRLIRLRNRKPVGSTDGHVQREVTPGTRIGEVNGVSVARPSAPIPSGLNGAHGVDTAAPSEGMAVG